jgi:pimeloyl-ACP methyl ester carboxylesterase
MTEFLDITGGQIAYDVTGEGPLIVLSHGIGDRRQAFRFLGPELARAGFRVAAADMRGHGESSLGDWKSISRTDVAGDLVALIRHLGGPAVIVGHSLPGGAATIAAATAPDLVSGVVEVGPFTRKVAYSLGGLLRIRRYPEEVARLTTSFFRERVVA